MTEDDTVSGEANDVATQPLSLMLPDLMENVRIHHWGFRKEAVMLGGKIFKVTVEEDPQQLLRNPRKHSLLPEYVESQERIDDSVTRNDPFLRPSQYGCLGGTGMDDKFQSFNRRCTSSNDQDILSLSSLAVEHRGMIYLAFEGFLVLHVRHLRVPTGSNSGYDTVESPV